MIGADAPRRYGDDDHVERITGWNRLLCWWRLVAPMMTAANLGARVTGGGFVVSTVGSIGWSLVGLGSGQTNLVATHVFLTLVNFVGVWRWLGRQRSYEELGRRRQYVEFSRRIHRDMMKMLKATGMASSPIKKGARDLGEVAEAAAVHRLVSIIMAEGRLAARRQQKIMRADALMIPSIGFDRLDQSRFPVAS